MFSRSKSFLMALAALAGISATAVPSAYAQYPDATMIAWCQNSLAQLDLAEALAQGAYSRGRLTEAAQHLTTGLQRASNQFGTITSTGPLTQKAIRRMLSLSRIVTSAAAGDPSAIRTQVYFLFKAYEFIRYVAESVDIPYHIPYYGSYQQGHCGGCGTFDIGGYEAAYVEYARQQLSLVLTALAQDNGGFVTTIGAPASFVKALAKTACDVASDLRQSIWATSYACQVVQLQQLYGLMSSVNPAVPYELPEAVQTGYAMGNSILNDIGVGYGCY